MKLFHRSSHPALASAVVGTVFSLRSLRAGAEGVGVYFAEGCPVRASTAEGTRAGETGIVEIDMPASPSGWWRSKAAKAKFGKPRTWHTSGKALLLTVAAVRTADDGVRVFSCVITASLAAAAD